jgi:hypothetical protein
VVLVETVVTAAALGVWWRYGSRAGPRLAWGACTVATLLLVAVGARDVLVGFTTRHSLGPIAGATRRWLRPSGPVVSYGRDWLSAAFYLRHESISLVGPTQRQALVDFLKRQPATLVLVESGPPLEEFLRLLPRTLKTVVQLPSREGQAAVVEVRQK